MPFLQVQDSHVIEPWKPHSEIAHRAVPTTEKARRQLASRICSLPFPNAEQEATLRALGHEAISAVIKAYPGASLQRRRVLATLIYRYAERSDTPAIYSLRTLPEAEIVNRRLVGFLPLSHIADWLAEKGDADYLATFVLPRFRAGRSGTSGYNDLSILLRSRRNDVVDHLFSLLKDGRTDPYVRSRIVNGIAYSERPDVLKWLRDGLSTSRRRTKPNAEMPPDEDADGDGIPDDFDINPLVPPRALTEEDCAVQAAFASCFRFQSPPTVPVWLFYPPGMAPFELLGFDATLLAKPRPRRAGFYSTRTDRRNTSRYG